MTVQDIASVIESGQSINNRGVQLVYISRCGDGYFAGFYYGGPSLQTQNSLEAAAFYLNIIDPIDTIWGRVPA